jgi:hypothetical protein
MGNIHANGYLWRSASPTPGYVFSIAAIFINHFILGSVVGDQAQESNGGGIASI